MFKPVIEKRKHYFRDCKCGRSHTNKFIRGSFKYSEKGEAIFCAALLEHSDERHVWVSFITGKWPETNHNDCAVTCQVFAKDGERVFRIEDGQDSPFELSDIFDCYQVSREQVIAVDGAKDWFISTYLSLFETDEEIGLYLR